MVTWRLRWWNSRRGRPNCERWHIRGVEITFSCREDTLYLLRAGRVHVLKPGATEGGWVVLHMALMVPVESQHHLRTSPAHLLLRGREQSRSPCWFHFLLGIRKHKSAQRKRKKASSRVSSSQSWNFSRLSCMFHTHSMNAFALHRKRHFLVLHWTCKASGKRKV